MSRRSPARALVVCDIGPDRGVGHLMRCLALAEELRGRGLRVQYVADVDAVPFAAQQLRRRRLPYGPPPRGSQGYEALFDAVRPELVVIDSYELPATVYTAARASGAVVVALVDGHPGDREADVYVNQNLGGEHPPPDLPPGAAWLGGLRYALMRDEIREAARPGRLEAAGRPRVLAFFGGTDPAAAAPAATALLTATGVPFEATIVGATRDLARQVRAVPTGPGQHVGVVAPLSRLASAVLHADVVVSAAGTSAWELLCLGAPAALVRVADNQRAGYDAVVRSGAARGLGAVGDLARDPAARATLTRLLTDAQLRAGLRARARSTVDGDGRRRVVDTALSALSLEGVLHGPEAR